MTTVNIPLLLLSLAIPIAIYFITKLIMKNKGENKEPLIFALISLVPIIIVMLFTGFAGTGLIFGIISIILLLAIPTAIYIITKRIIKKKENANNKISIVAMISSILSVLSIALAIIASINLIGQLIAINRINGVWETDIEIIELQRRDNRLYIDNAFAGYWSVEGLSWGSDSGYLTFRFLDDTRRRLSIRLVGNDNTFIISAFVDGERIDVANYWRIE